MKLETLVATMNRSNFDFLNKMNISTSAIIINQNTTEKIDYIGSKREKKVISTTDIGLSKSRNLALKHAQGDVCIIADDDVIYDNDYVEKIKKAHLDYPNADIIAFQVDRFGNPNRKKNFRTQSSWDNYITSMKISSVEITFKRKSILKNNIWFNENIGAGTEFPNGEESVFLYESLNSGLSILYLPIKIGSVDISDSTWYKGYDNKHFQAIGAKFYNMTRRYYWALILQFSIRKYSEYRKTSSFINAVKQMYKGKKQYAIRYEKTNLK